MPDSLHPIIIHFPIAMLILGSITLWISLRKPALYSRMTDLLLIGGLATMLVAMITGMRSVDYAIYKFGAERDLINTHQTLSMITFALFLVLLALKFALRKRPSRWSAALFILLSVAGVVMLFISGDFGGQIVYGDRS
ncbi:DUF2231 domain-containing protein [Paenibacillus sp. NEAU-GSW1]|uniref:DUF2231 domain-containing protein n=1 Tax=Paenibacillus sp. NEAU-GSW1 TaxID=2682486 RepID=UPI0012E15743|nr:DUF2231 domain-containing protein [Paenibacillus sp. NEAU-GSW1]MUT68347.1 DUF2231 domain-containing protein [Paenibacillus sp. NEAU-GSW1]